MFSLPRQPERGSDATQQGQNAIKAMFGANDVTVVNSATIGSQCSITLPKEDQHNRDDRQSDFCENWYGRGDFESIIILNAVGESVSRSFVDPSMPNDRTVKYTDLGPSDIVVISGNLSKHPEDPQEQTFRAVRGEAHLLEYEQGRSMIAVRRQDDASKPPVVSPVDLSVDQQIVPWHRVTSGSVSTMGGRGVRSFQSRA
jgi:hypothetical protein